VGAAIMDHERGFKSTELEQCCRTSCAALVSERDIDHTIELLDQDRLYRICIRSLEMQGKYQVGLRLYRDGIGHIVQVETKSIV
jgi:hypothetical protein